MHFPEGVGIQSSKVLDGEQRKSLVHVLHALITLLVVVSACSLITHRNTHAWFVLFHMYEALLEPGAQGTAGDLGEGLLNTECCLIKILINIKHVFVLLFFSRQSV